MQAGQGLVGREDFLTRLALVARRSTIICALEVDSAVVKKPERHPSATSLLREHGADKGLT